MDHWDLLRRRYTDDGLALFVGAGISVGSKIPAWGELICRVMECLGDETGGGPAFELYRAAGFSLPTITEFIERKLCDEQRFVAALRDCLYRDFPCRWVQDVHEQKSAREIVDHIKRDNRTLDAVYSLSVRNSDVGLQVNPRVHGIINFNLDSLLESYDAARNQVRGVEGTRRCLRTIESPSHDPASLKISCYHPHGYLRFDRHAASMGKEAKTRVLAEHQFFEFYNRPTDLFTNAILYFLKAYHCLFIGMSMTDDNVRRLLFYSKTERDRSRIRERLHPKKPRHFVLILEPDKNSRQFDFTETMLNALGILPLWIKSFDDIPAKLEMLAP
jgi:SIR2-like domain